MLALCQLSMSQLSVLKKVGHREHDSIPNITPSIVSVDLQTGRRLDKERDRASHSASISVSDPCLFL